MSEKLPTVSIIIPCFNYAHFLRDAIDTALDQTYARCEVIIVDDGSTDDTAQVAQSYGDSIRYHYKKNAGLSAARNTGIKISQGEFLVFLDADDRLKPQMVSRSYGAMMQLGEEFGIVASHTLWMDKEGRAVVKPSVFFEENCEISALDVLIRNRFAVTVLARRSIFEQCGGFDEQLRASEDRDMWIRAAFSGFRMMRLGESLFSVRRHGENMSSDGDTQSRSVKRIQQKALAAGVLTGWENLYRMKVKSYYMCQTSIMRATKQPFRSSLRMIVSIVLWPVFMDLKSLGEKPGFRIKMLKWILSQVIRRGS